MSNHYNKLSNKQTELLDLLQEEASDIIKAISKIKRHGLDEYRPAEKDNPVKVTNQFDLQKAIGHFSNAVALLVDEGLVDTKLIADMAISKSLIAGKHLHHQNEDRAGVFQSSYGLAFTAEGKKLLNQNFKKDVIKAWNLNLLYVKDVTGRLFKLTSENRIKEIK